MSYSVDVGRRPCLGADGIRKGHEEARGAEKQVSTIG